MMRASPKVPHVVFVEGIIAAGKTTFCNKLVTYLRDKHDLHVVLCKEPVDLWIADGTLEASYTDPAKYSFAAQCHFFNTRVDGFRRLWNEHASTADIIVCERSMLSDKMFFLTKVAEGHVDERWAAAYFGLWSKWQELLPITAPSLVVYLQMSDNPNVAMTRIESRGRVEEKNITSDYQTILNSLHDDLLVPHVTLPDETTAPTLTLDASLDFKSNDDIFNEMAEKIVLQLL